MSKCPHCRKPSAAVPFEPQVSSRNIFELKFSTFLAGIFKTQNLFSKRKIYFQNAKFIFKTQNFQKSLSSLCMFWSNVHTKVTKSTKTILTQIKIIFPGTKAKMRTF
jgi:hypothetical protein